MRVVIADIVPLPGITDHGVEGVPVALVVIIAVGLQKQVAVEILIVGREVRRRAHGAVRTEDVILVADGLGDVVTEVEVEAEIFQPVDFVVRLHVADAAERPALVVEVIQGGHRAGGRHRVGRAILVVPVPVGTVRIGDGLGRIEGDGTAHGAAVGPDRPLVDTLQVNVEGEMVVQEFRREVQVGIEAVVVAELDGSLVQVVSDAGAERNLLAAVETEVVVGGDADAVDLALPVGVGRAEEAGIFRMILVHGLAELVAVHHIEGGDVLLGAETAIVGNLEFPAAAFLRRDDDDAVGSAGTVDGRRGSVFQDRETLDVVGVDRSKRVAHACAAVTGYRHAVDDDERVVAGGQGCGAADADRSAVTGLSGSGYDVQTGNLAHERLARGVDGTTVDFVIFDGDDGTRHITLFDGTVADDHDLVQELVVFREGDGGGHFGCLEGQGGVADAAHLDGRIRRRNPEGEVAVKIRHGTVVRARLEDGGSDHGTHLVDDHTPDHIAALGKCGGAHHARKHDGRKDG